MLRPFYLDGPGQSGMLIASLIDRVVAGEDVEVSGNPGIRLSPIYVDDAASAFAAALEIDGDEVSNVAGLEAVTLTELVELIGEVAGLPPGSGMSTRSLRATSWLTPAGCESCSESPRRFPFGRGSWALGGRGVEARSVESSPAESRR